METKEIKKLLGTRERPEATFQKKVVKFLQSLNIGLVHQVRATGRFYTEKGWPDLFFYSKMGTFAFELKASQDSAVSSEQLVKMKELTENGVQSFLVFPENYEEFKAYLLHLVLAYKSEAKTLDCHPTFSKKFVTMH